MNHKKELLRILLKAARVLVISPSAERWRTGAWVLRAPIRLTTCRFMGSYKWSYKSLDLGYAYSYPTYNPTYNYP